MSLDSSQIGNLPGNRPRPLESKFVSKFGYITSAPDETTAACLSLGVITGRFDCPGKISQIDRVIFNRRNSWEMEFNAGNNVVRLCVQGMNAEGEGKHEEASRLFLQAWTEATVDFEKFIAAYVVADRQKDVRDKLQWFGTALQFALKANNEAVKAAFRPLYLNIAGCYEALGDRDNATKNRASAMSFTDEPSDNGPFYHGTKAELQVGDLLAPGGRSNYKPGLIMNHIYFTALVNGAGLAAALAQGEGRERVYIVEPTGSFENDPNVTNKKFPGNPTRSYRTQAPLKIVGEATNWVRQTPGELKEWREKLANVKGDIIN